MKHLAFFEALADTPEETPAYRAAVAGLLTLRLVDHWVLAGSVMVEPESVSIRSVRQAIMAIAANDPQRELLLGLVNTMQTVREVDMQPVLPRLFAYGELLEKRGVLSLAADAYASVVCLGERDYDSELVIDSNMRLGFCRRMLGALSEAEEAYVAAGKIAKRRNDLARVLHSRIGVAKVAMERGNLPAADQMLGEVAAECATRGFQAVQAMALHDQAAVAIRRGDHARGVCLAYAALERTDPPAARERVLHDIAASFVAMGRFSEARTALLIQEATATSMEMRCAARVNLLSMAAREGDREAFAAYEELLKNDALPAEIEVNYLIERARGIRRFGSVSEAEALLRRASSLASAHGFSRSVFEAEEMLTESVPSAYRSSGEIPVPEPDPAAHVSAGLRQMLASLAA